MFNLCQEMFTNKNGFAVYKHSRTVVSVCNGDYNIYIASTNCGSKKYFVKVYNHDTDELIKTSTLYSDFNVLLNKVKTVFASKNINTL